MTNPPHTGPDSSAPLPRPDLNPLLNPTLEQNLGRWAQVYFTNPPEKREQAVSDLLRELGGKPPEPSPGKLPEGSTLPKEIVCPACKQKITATEKFCGTCGFALQDRNLPQTPNPGPDPVEIQDAASVPQISAENDLDWLRERAVTRLDARSAPTRRRWKYPVLAIALLLSGLIYLRWSSQPQSSTPAPAIPHQAAAQSPSETVKPLPPAPRKESAPVSAPVKQVASPTENLNQPAPASVAVIEATNGSSELLLAQGYLEGKNGPRDTSAAATWLWKAVSKKNTTAILLLADLYLHGDGVPKDCDQARLLLGAAARAGSPEATQKLQHLESEGCQ